MAKTLLYEFDHALRYVHHGEDAQAEGTITRIERNEEDVIIITIQQAVSRSQQERIARELERLSEREMKILVQTGAIKTFLEVVNTITAENQNLARTARRLRENIETETKKKNRYRAICYARMERKPNLP